MEEKRYSANILEDAITEACVDLGLSSDMLSYTVVQQGSKGFFGFGAKPFIISVKLKEEKTEDPAKAENAKKNNTQKPSEKPVKAEKSVAKDQKNHNDRKQNNEQNGQQNKNNGKNNNQNPKKKFNEDRKPEKTSKEGKKEEKAVEKKAPVVQNVVENREKTTERRTERTGVVTGDPVKTAETFLTGLFKGMEMNISYKGEFISETNDLKIDLSGEDMGVLIGKHGQTLDALQYLTSQVVNKHQSAYIRVKLDTENYRERRKETMETLAQNIAQKVKRTKKPVALEPMNPYERRIIHSVLQADKEVITRSEGVEPYRHVVVCPVRKKKSGN